MRSICICGAGTMGSGIAQVVATTGFRTVLYDLSEDVLQRAKDRIQGGLQFLVDKQKISSSDKESTWNNILFTTDLHQCMADVVIEAVVEKPEVKRGLFQKLSEINGPATLFVTNTSSLSITEIAKGMSFSHRFAGMHFFNPAPVMKLVEIVKGSETTEETIIRFVELARKLGKVPVVCKDAPGFIVNRVARPYYIESLRLTEEGLAGFETIDRLLESKGFKMGPFRLMDLIGNDINYAVSCSVYEQLQRPERLRPSWIQKEKVEQGALGKKAGKGYYTY